MADVHRLIEIASLHHGVITDRDVAAAGVSRRRWRHMQDQGFWIEIAPHHFRHSATPMTFEMQVRTGASWLGSRAALWGDSGLCWLGVEVPEPERVGFLLPRSETWVPHWMELHTTRAWDDGDIIRHHGVRTSTATRAIIDFAARTPSARALEEAIDSAIRLRRTALPRLIRRVQELGGRGRTGTRLLRELLLDSGGESYLERRFLRLIRQSGLPRPLTQVPIRRSGGRVTRVDFHFGFAIVEVGGRLGHTSDSDRQRDARRRNFLQQSERIPVLEFTTSDVIDDPLYVVGTIRSELERRGSA